MKPFDLIRLILGNLSRRKARVALTAIGVVIGTAAVVILVSLAIGLQRNANEQLYGIGDLKQIQVSPSFGGEGGVKVVSGGGGPVPSQPQQQALLTNFALSDLRAIPGVDLVIPRDYLMAGGTIKYQKLEAGVNIVGVDTTDLSNLGLEAMEGGTELGRGEVVIGVMVPNNFYDPRIRPGQDPPPPPQLYGQQLQLVVSKWDEQGNETRKTLSLRVAGVLKE